MSSYLWPILPALLIGLLALWSGTFAGAASSGGATIMQIAVLGFFILGAQEWRDPLRLGIKSRWLVPGLLVVAGLSCWLSPVSRAGRTGLVLLPAFLMLPAAVSACWPNQRLKRRGQAAISLVVLLVAGLAITGRLYFDSPRAASPFGHHTLLAGWLVLLLPFVLESGFASTKRRWLAFTTGVVGLSALALTGSLLGGLVVLVQFVVAIVWWRLPKRWLAVPIVALVLLLLPRLGRITEGMDTSARARAVYVEAGIAGIEQKPLFGWGPGATPWTIAEFTRPVPNLNPSSEIIGDLHSLPIQLGYEIGLLGLGLSGLLVLLFLKARLSEVGSERALTRKAACLGFLGGVLFSLGAAPLAVPALPVAAAVVAGACLPHPRRSQDQGRLSKLLPAAVYLLPAAVLLLPTALAHRYYDLARTNPKVDTSIENLESAVELDPQFPLYRARAAWLKADESVSRSTAEDALRAAEQARGLAPLWLEAGYLGLQAEATWASAALETASRLDPLSSLTAFHCMTSQPSTPQAIGWGSRALSAEPDFAKARFWREHPGLAESVGRTSGIRPDTWPLDEKSRLATFAMVLDKDPSLSFSLYAFRRSPWPGALAPIELVMPLRTKP